MKIWIIAISLCSLVAVAGPARKPNQDTTYPNYPTSPTTPTPGIGMGTAAFVNEDAMAAGSMVQTVYCLTGTSQSYVLSGATGNDVRVARVSAGGAITYEVYKGQRFVGSCPAIHIMAR